MKKPIAVVCGDGWEGLYVNGKLVEENHHLTLFDFVKLTGIKCEFIEPDMEWLDERGRLPEKLEDVKVSKE